MNNNPVKVLASFENIQYDVEPLKMAHEGDAAYDIRANISGIIKPGEKMAIPTGVKLAIPNGYCCFVQPRSGLAAKNGVTVANSPGLIDSGYRNEIFVILINHGDKDFSFAVGDRIAQLLFIELPKVVFEETSELPDTDRGIGGLGSSGVK